MTRAECKEILTSEAYSTYAMKQALEGKEVYDERIWRIIWYTFLEHVEFWCCKHTWKEYLDDILNEKFWNLLNAVQWRFGVHIKYEDK